MTTPVDDVFSFGTWVRRRRKVLDLTQAALADRVGCAEVTIRKLEGDAFRPSREIAERLADCLDIPLHERALFLQTARGERRVERLPTPNVQLDLAFRSTAQVQQSVVFIPLDTLPQPTPLPPGSRMPLSRNPLFVGREANLRQLATSLQVGGTAAIGQREITAATGLGGIGKTQLACEFVHRYGQFFPGGVFWLSFADPAAVPAEVAACGGADGMQLRPEFGTLPLDEQVKLVLAAWESSSPRLLVFDNCEEQGLLDQWRPKYGGCRVLLTSRRHHWDAALGVQALPLDVLPHTESLALLRTFRPDLLSSDADLSAIAEALGELPLALHLAGSFLAKYRHVITLPQYLQRLRTPTILDDRSLQAIGLSPTKHVQHVARTFEQSYERLNPLDTTDGLALMFLARAACFAPGEQIPHWLLLETLNLGDDPDASFLAEDALARLVDLGLLETDDEIMFRLHRLLVAFVRTVTTDTTAEAIVEATILRVIDSLNMIRKAQPLLGLQAHLRFIACLVQQREDERAASFYHALGFHFWLLGRYPDAQDYYQRALTIRERILGMEHQDTAWSLNGLGQVLHRQGEYKMAQDYYQRALAIQERILGMEHSGTAWSLNGLGQVLYAQGAYRDAQRYHEQALAIHKRVMGPEHSDTAWSLDNLGQALHAQGAYRDAQYYLEQALAIRERVMGPEHSDTAWSLDNLGEVLQAQGEYAGARRYHEQALGIWERVMGPEHPDTARSVYNLGTVLQSQGQYAVAQGYLEQALMIQQRVLGIDHPDTAKSLRSLGELLHAHRDTVQARHYLEHALTIFELRLGPHHPDTEQTRRVLVTLDATRNIADPES